MKKYLFLICSLALLLSCQKEDPYIVNNVEGHYIDSFGEKTLTYQEYKATFDNFISGLVMAIGQENLTQIVSTPVDLLFGSGRTVLEYNMRSESGTLLQTPEWRIKYVNIRYRSIDQNGDPIILGANLQYPVYRDGSLHELSGVELYFNPFAPGQSCAITNSNYSYDNRALYDKLVVNAEFQSTGVSAGAPMMVFNNVLVGRQSADAVLAALEYIKSDTSVRLPEDYGTALIGVSHGGMRAAATMKYLDTVASEEVRETINPIGIFSACAPYNQEIVFENFVDNSEDGDLSETVGAQYLLPFFLQSCYNQHPEYFKTKKGKSSVRDFFSEEFLELSVRDGKDIVDFLSDNSAEYDYYLEAVAAVGNDPRRICSSQMFNEDGTLNTLSYLVDGIYRCISENNLDSVWTLTADMKIAYCPQDEFIPTESTLTMYNMLRTNAESGVSVSMDRFQLPSMLEGYAHSLGSNYYIFYLLVGETPWI